MKKWVGWSGKLARWLKKVRTGFWESHDLSENLPFIAYHIPVKGSSPRDGLPNQGRPSWEASWKEAHFAFRRLQSSRPIHLGRFLQIQTGNPPWQCCTRFVHLPLIQSGKLPWQWCTWDARMQSISAWGWQRPIWAVVHFDTTVCQISKPYPHPKNGPGVEGCGSQYLAEEGERISVAVHWLGIWLSFKIKQFSHKLNWKEIAGDLDHLQKRGPASLQDASPSGWSGKKMFVQDRPFCNTTAQLDDTDHRQTSSLSLGDHHLCKKPAHPDPDLIFHMAGKCNAVPYAYYAHILNQLKRPIPNRKIGFSCR